MGWIFKLEVIADDLGHWVEVLNAVDAVNYYLYNSFYVLRDYVCKPKY